ncbi:MAG: hypothetical protein WCR61_04655 [Bacteroidales bacterium]
MRIIYKKYLPKEDIPVYDFVRKRKLVKYYTRETMAAVVCTGLLLKGQEVSEETPFFFSNSESEMMDYYRDACIAFDQKRIPFTTHDFIKIAVPSISPLSHFKMMRNMAHCFISIEYGLKGDNAALLGSASGLLYSALLADTDKEVYIGAGKLHVNGTAEAGFGILLPYELKNHRMLDSNSEAINFFRQFHNFK